MLELNFGTFMEELEKAQMTRNEDRRKLHWAEDETYFYLYLKSADYWEYTTKVLKETVRSFGREYESENAIEDFKMNVLRAGIRLARPLNPVVVVSSSVAKEAGIELIDEVTAEDYADFLQKKFKLWEKRILRFVDEELKEDLSKGLIGEVQEMFFTKGFGEFLRRLFNTVHTAGFFSSLKAVIKATLNKGINEAEAELKIDVGFKPTFDQEVDNLTKRQLDGFFIEGKKWDGIKGVAKDVQEDMRELVLHGIAEKKGLSLIKDEIREKMAQYAGGKVKGEVTEGRAMSIARTETNRIINLGKVKAYKESGIKGKKVWDAFLDDRTTAICRRLNGKKVGLSENFKDELGEWSQPPAHTNCRSVVRFELD